MKGNHWIINSVIRQHSSVHTARIGNELIFTKNSVRPFIKDISLWIVEKEGKMSIPELQVHFEELFGIQLRIDKLTYKLREAGCIDRIVNDDWYLDDDWL